MKTDLQMERLGFKKGGYTIKKGDTLSELAVRFDTSVKELLKANKKIKDPDLIFAGAKLNIPEKVVKSEIKERITMPPPVPREEIKVVPLEELKIKPRKRVEMPTPININDDSIPMPTPINRNDDSITVPTPINRNDDSIPMPSLGAPPMSDAEKKFVKAGEIPQEDLKKLKEIKKTYRNRGQEAEAIHKDDEEFYTGILPLAARQLASDTKYDFLRNIFTKDRADKLTQSFFGEEENITKKDFSEEEFTLLKNIVMRNISQDKFVVDYDDWRDFGAGGTSTVRDNPFELINNPARSLQYTFGQGSIAVEDNGDIYFRDQFNFNDAKLSNNPRQYYGPEWDEDGYLKMEYTRGLKGFLSNQFKKIRNYKTRVGRGEGEGAKTNILLGNINDLKSKKLIASK